MHSEKNKWFLLRHVGQEKCCILDQRERKPCLIHLILIWITITEDACRSDIIYHMMASIFRLLYPSSIMAYETSFFAKIRNPTRQVPHRGPEKYVTWQSTESATDVLARGFVEWCGSNKRMNSEHAPSKCIKQFSRVV